LADFDGSGFEVKGRFSIEFGEGRRETEDQWEKQGVGVREEISSFTLECVSGFRMA
jgi:hypothetical protein